MYKLDSRRTIVEEGEDSTKHHLFTRPEVRAALIKVFGEPKTQEESVFLESEILRVHGTLMPIYTINIHHHRAIHQNHPEPSKLRRAYKSPGEKRKLTLNKMVSEETVEEPVQSTTENILSAKEIFAKHRKQLKQLEIGEFTTPEPEYVPSSDKDDLAAEQEALVELMEMTFHNPVNVNHYNITNEYTQTELGPEGHATYRTYHQKEKLQENALLRNHTKRYPTMEEFKRKHSRGENFHEDEGSDYGG